MKTNWQTKKLSEILKLEYGKPLSKNSRSINGKYPVYGANGIKGFSDEFYYDKLSIIVGRKGSAGEINLTKEKFWPLDVTYFVTFDDKKYHLKFLYNLLETLELTKLAKGVKPGINRNEVYSINVKIPTLPEQNRIVKILDKVFGEIEKAKENTEKNLQNAKDLFESYLRSVFTNSEWAEKTLRDVCEIQSRLIDPRKQVFLNLIHVGAGNIEIKTGKLINLKTSREERLISGKFQFDSSMVLYSKIRPYLMKVVRPNFQGLCSADIYPLLPYKDLIMRDYLFYLLLTPIFTEFAIKGSARAGMPKVNRDHLFAFNFFLPPVDEQKSIVKKLDLLSDKTKRLEEIYKQKLADLEELKKSILAKAFNGEL